MSKIDTYEKETLPTIEEIINYYLYGQKDKPADMLNPSTWASNQPGFNGTTEVAIDYATALNQMTRFLDASSFELIRVFMGLNALYPDRPQAGLPSDGHKETYGDYRNRLESLNLSKIEPIRRDDEGNDCYSKEQLIYGLYFMGEQVLSESLKHYEYDVDSKDYLQRAIIWATQSFMINPDTEFVIKKDGTREIRNFSIVHRHLLDSVVNRF